MSRVISGHSNSPHQSRPFRFGTRVGAQQGSAATGRSTAERWKASAQKAESDGYAWVSVPDHLYLPGSETMAPIATMMAMAAATSTLRVTTTVLDNNFRHPLVVAKEIATIDIFSDGRVDLGIGAGSLHFEHCDYLGLADESVPTRVRRLEEALQLIRGFWGNAPFTMEGEFYSVRTPLDGTPKPFQKPGPPIRLGGYGKRLLSLAGRSANIVNILVRPWPRYRSYAEMSKSDYTDIAAAKEHNLAERIAWIRDSAADRFEEIELELLLWGCVVTDKPAEAARALIPMAGKSTEEVLASPDVMMGTSDFIVERMHELRERYGISSFAGAPAEIVRRLAGTV